MKRVTYVLISVVFTLIGFSLGWAFSSWRLEAGGAAICSVAVLDASSFYQNSPQPASLFWAGKSAMPLEQLATDLGIATPGRVAVLAESGGFHSVSAEGELLVEQGGCRYVHPGATGPALDEVQAILWNAPAASITQACTDALKALDEGERVLLLLLDGFSYRQYQLAVAEGYAPNLQSLGAEPALSVWRPVTNAGMAAIITGEPPAVNGVHSRDQRNLQVPSVFGRALEMGRSAVLIEGNIQILQTEVEPRLNLDANQRHGTDDEVQEAALEALTENPDLLMVHYHGIDDAGHAGGPTAPATLERIRLIDSYVGQLLELWPGSVVLVADHGMHADSAGGSHGVLCLDDLIVPYAFVRGGDR
ncbi:MAG: alkaline phosphatase family protein [Bacillota bacterium]|jgi:hypothetical protein